MARLGPRHSDKDSTKGLSAAEKREAATAARKVRGNSKLLQTGRKATGRANNPPA